MRPRRLTRPMMSAGPSGIGRHAGDAENGLRVQNRKAESLAIGENGEVAFFARGRDIGYRRNAVRARRSCGELHVGGLGFGRGVERVGERFENGAGGRAGSAGRPCRFRLRHAACARRRVLRDADDRHASSISLRSLIALHEGGRGDARVRRHRREARHRSRPEAQELVEIGRDRCGYDS